MMTQVEPGGERGNRDREGGDCQPAGRGAELPDVDLVVLAGGRGERLGGADKAALVVGGRTLLERVLDAELGGRVVVVGDTPVPAGVDRTLENPPGGGPVAGIAAGLAALDARPAPRPAVWVAICAVDQPQAAGLLALLRARLPRVGAGVDALCPSDGTGRRQWLLAVYRRAGLEAALRSIGEARHASVRSLVADLRWGDVEVDPGQLGDIDTWEDLRRWE
ncbi:NTP transferase domain-containing protein [uncultured Serinicoccus sp.]|uniref:molybdenum cofactor guanylyltransferase n=1 Tax=uncultured Serinicoccus sp. TaxID=735514 RepID=UPI0026178957|nr:NTP transferase domain-containing protein [uncultured Serinicoccus sp.]